MEGVGKDGASGLQASLQYPRFRMGGSCRVRESGPRKGKMGMKPGGIIAVALQRSNHAGEGTAIPGGILKELLDRGMEALAQQAEQLVFESGDFSRREGKPDPLFVHGYGVPDVYRAAGLREIR